MFRPSLHPSAHQRAFGRNLALDLASAIGVGVTAALVTTLLPTIARRGGLEPVGLAIRTVRSRGYLLERRTRGAGQLAAEA